MDFERYMDCISRYLSLEYDGNFCVFEVVEAALEAYNFGLSVPAAAADLILILKENKDVNE